MVRKRQKRWRRISKSCHASIARAHPRATKGSLLDHGHDEVARVPGVALPPEPLEPRRPDRRSRRPSKHPQAPNRIPHAPSLNAHPESLEVARRVARGMSQSLCIVLLLLTSGALSAETTKSIAFGILFCFTVPGQMVLAGKAWTDGFTYLDPAHFHAYFAADLSAEQAASMARSQVLNAADNFRAVISAAAWRSKPS